MKVVLVAIHLAPSPQAMPLANAFLKAYTVTDEGLTGKLSVELCDLFSTQETADCAASILRHNPDAVGFSLYLWNREKSLMIADILRKERPELTIFAGGPEATAVPEHLIPNSSLDYLILGEGEIPFLETMGRLLEGKSPKGVAGTAYLKQGKTITHPQMPASILDTIPSPYLSGILDLGDYCGALWQMSRGCDFACDYCFDYKGKRGVRRFSLERIDAELDLFVQHRVPQVFVLDSTFNVDMKRAKTILRMIRKRAPHIHFHFEVRSEFIDREMAGLFADITCSLQIGLQSADTAVLKGIRRAFDPNDFRDRIALLNESGTIFGFDLIYGLPGDTLRGFADSLNFALGLYPNHLDIFPLAVLPGTSLAQKADQLGLSSLQFPPYTLLRSPTFPQDEMNTAHRLAVACDIFYSRGKAVAWFNTVIAALETTPADFLFSFRDWLDHLSKGVVSEADFTDHEVWQLQRKFLHHIFEEKNLVNLLPAALDLIDYHYHFCAALLTPPPELPTDRELSNMKLLDLSPTISPSTRLTRFSYDIYELLDAGEVDLRDFSECFSPTGSYAAIYPRGDEILTESLLEPYYMLLEHLDGITTAGEIAFRQGIVPDEAASFLEFAAAEGIICMTNLLSRQ